MNIKRVKVFPRDCGKCKYHISYDMSVDDITHICKINGMQLDDCDISYYSIHKCPKGKKKKNTKV